MTKKPKTEKCVESKSVNIEKAANGFVITHYNNSNGMRSMEVAKTIEEANKVAARILKG